MNSFDALELKAGKSAHTWIMDGGLKPEMIRVMAGAAGGPKWIVLGHLDRFIFGEWLKGHKKPISFLASSIGAWRFASSMAFEDPLKGLELFKEGYFEQSYSDKPTREEITATFPQVMGSYINEETIPRILNHAYGRLHLLAVRSKGLVASENRLFQGLGLLATMMGNAMSRKSLKAFFERTRFFDPREPENFMGEDTFPRVDVALTEQNFEEAMLATSAIPMVMAGIPDVTAAPKGMYRDGGLIDYHLTFPYELGEGEIVFQPHFFEEVKPGWFDKRLKSRKPSEAERDRVLLAYPSKKFIEGLPDGRVTDRKDFEVFSTTARQKRWEQAFDQSQRLADDFAEWILSGKIKDKVKLWV
ncbi:MAG: alpha/beta hydrolase [Bacteroidota bacterium]